MTTSSYFGLNRPFGFIKNNQVTAATSSTSTTSVELRVDVVEQYSSGRRITKMEVIMALKALMAYFMKGGSQLGVGEGGAGGDDQGLDNEVPLPIGAPLAGG